MVGGQQSTKLDFKREQVGLLALDVELADDHLDGYVYRPDRFKAQEREKRLWEESLETQLTGLLGPLPVLYSEKAESWVNEECLFEVQQGIAYVTLNRPAANNAMNDNLTAGLIDAARILKGRPDIRVAVLTGNGRMFCAGGDPKSFQAAQAEAGAIVGEDGEGEQQPQVPDRASIMGSTTSLEAQGRKGTEKKAVSLTRVFFEWSTLPQLTIAQLNGSAMGGGVGLVCCCDMAIAVKAAHITLSEVKLGVIPAVISPHVIRTIGAANAKKLFVTAENCNMQQAKEYGMVQRIVNTHAELPGVVKEIAQKVQSCAPGAVSAGKTFIMNCLNQPMSEDLLRFTAAEYVRVRKGEECEEGMRAVAARTKPHWVTSPIAVKEAS